VFQAQALFGGRAAQTHHGRLALDVQGSHVDVACQEPTQRAAPVVAMQRRYVQLRRVATQA
jgi:hypothetical protein